MQVNRMYEWAKSSPDGDDNEDPSTVLPEKRTTARDEPAHCGGTSVKGGIRTRLSVSRSEKEYTGRIFPTERTSWKGYRMNQWR